MLLKLGRGIAADCQKGNGSEPGGGGSSYLDGIIASACCDLDATIAASYAGSGQTWSNLVASPADGEGQSAYDFNLGLNDSSSTDEPSFTGTAGDAAAYWSFDGGDMFKIKACNAAPDDGSLNPASLKNFGKSDASGAVTILMAFRTPSSITGNFNLFDNRTNTDGSQYHGVLLFWFNSQSAVRVLIEQDNVPSFVDLGGTALSADTDYILAFATDPVNSKVYHALNATSFTETAFSFQSGTNDADAGAALCSDARGVGNLFPNGAALYHFSVFDEVLNDTQLAAAISHLEDRHSRGYTP